MPWTAAGRTHSGQNPYSDPGRALICISHNAEALNQHSEHAVQKYRRRCTSNPANCVKVPRKVFPAIIKCHLPFCHQNNRRSRHFKEQSSHYSNYTDYWEVFGANWHNEESSCATLHSTFQLAPVLVFTRFLFASFEWEIGHNICQIFTFLHVYSDRSW